MLYSAALRDFLLRIASQKVFSPRWTLEIHDEWVRSLLRDRAELSKNRILRTRDLMFRAMPDALVTGHEWLIPNLTLPDPNDRHVLAAAIQSRSDFLVTFNLSDFPKSLLTPYGIDPVDPDTFILELLSQNEDGVLEALIRLQLSLKNPPRTLKEVILHLETCGLPRTSSALRSRIL
ncbi:PIN domain-containing protein [Crocosphaera subtropica]|uniref:PIN domain-containing protein n=1 Tax=Crocosphaera subtropica TaxID=2546360 RepID=UPI0002313C2C